MNKLVKYALIAADEQDLELVGVYADLEEAQQKMRDAFMHMIDVDDNISQDELNQWIEETYDAGIDEYQARMLDSVSIDGHNHDWNLEKISAMGECRKAEENDEDIVIGTYKMYLAYWGSGMYFCSPCKVNTKTKQVFDIGIAGCSDECTVVTETVEIDEKEVPVVLVDDVILDYTPVVAKEELERAKEFGQFWVSDRFKTLEEAIASCRCH